MGSSSDWETMQAAADTLSRLSIAHEVRVISAHRTPDLLFEYAASARERGLKAIIAGAGGAAHLPGMTAAKTSVPVLGVPIQSKTLKLLPSASPARPTPPFSRPRCSPMKMPAFAAPWMHFARRKPRR